MLEATTHQAGSTSQTIPDIISDHCATSPIQSVSFYDKRSCHIAGNDGEEERHTKQMADYSFCALVAPLATPKLSRRLNTLIQLASDFKIIWDICCDHGKAGITLVMKDTSREVHCIDRS